MKKAGRFSYLVLVVFLGVGVAGAAGANSGAATDCEQQLTPATMDDLRTLYYKAEAQSLPPEQQPMARALYQQTLRTVAAAYSTTREELHAWVISECRQSPESVDDSSFAQDTSIDHTPPRMIFHRRLKHVLKKNVYDTASIVFSPDSKRIVPASGSFFFTTAHLWDVTTGKELLATTSDWREVGVNSVAFSADGSKIITTEYDRLTQIWDTTTGKAVGQFTGHGSLSPDGTKVITTNLSENIARIWDAITKKEIITLSGHTNTISNASFSPDSKRVITSSQDGTVRIWNAETPLDILDPTFEAVVREEIHTLTKDEGPVRSGIFPHGIFSPDGTKVLTTSPEDSNTTVQVWNTKTGKEVCKLNGHSDLIRTATFFSESTKVVTISNDNTIRTWDATTGKLQLTLSNPNNLSGTPELILSLNPSPNRLSPDSTKVIYFDGTCAHIWDVATNEELYVLNVQNSIISNASFSPDGTKLVTTSLGGKMHIWDLYVSEDELLDGANASHTEGDSP